MIVLFPGWEMQERKWFGEYNWDTVVGFTVLDVHLTPRGDAEDIAR